MDEVDSMINDERGVDSLIKMIGETNAPIICISNNRIHPQMR